MKIVLFFSFWLALTSLHAQVHSVAIIGGGSAGIAAAHAIHSLDSTALITLYEKNPQLGGNAHTVKVMNLGKEVSVDMGPQYFTEGAWDNYIALLNAYNLYDEGAFTRFTASFTLADSENKAAFFRTPKDGKTREKWAALLHFNTFYSSARKLYEHPERFPDLTVGEWIEDLRLNEEFKNGVILPFLCASLGVDAANISRISAKEIVKLFAFRGALQKNTFNVLHQGMGGSMQVLAEQLLVEGIEVRTNAEVVSVQDIEPGLYLTLADGSEGLYDFVVFATHPDAIHAMVKESPEFAATLPILENLHYFQADIVLHRDPSFLPADDPSFLNVLVDSTNTVVASTMDLGAIDPRYEGLYKSWLPPDQKAEVLAKGLLVATMHFYHPLIDLTFIENIERLKELEQSTLHPLGFAFAGAWIMGMETQETAVLSGQRAAAAYMKRYFAAP